MSKSDIDILEYKDLETALLQVDKVIMHKYISDINKRAVFVPSFDVSFSDIQKEPSDDIPLCIVGTNIMLAKLTRIVLDKDENILDKLTTVYNATSLYESATLVMLLKCDGIQIDVYVGTVCKKTDDPFVPQKQIESFIRNLEANFPGSKLEEIKDLSRRMEIVQGIFEEKVCVSAVTGIAALKDKDNKENIKYLQGLEKLADSLKGKKCTVMIIADPVSGLQKESIRAGYEEIYSALKPFEKSEYSVNSSNGKTVTDSIIKGITDTTNESLAKTKTHTITKGTNSSHTVGGSIGMNASIGADVSLSSNLSATPFGVGTTVGGSIGVNANVGVSASADYHYMRGSHKDTSDAEGSTTTTGTSKSLSKQNSLANALSSNQGEGLQITYENRSIKSILERIDLQLKRISNCEDYGMYDCGVYILSKEYGTCLSVASSYKSIIQGESSSLESSHINIWDENESEALIPYLSTFNHPIFDIADKEGEKSIASATTLISGKELSLYMGLPKKSISGIPVIECAGFGRNIFYPQKNSDSKKINIGKIHHMYEDEATPVLLDKNSFSSHTFVTGSTGSGKSNTVYQLIDKLCFEICDKDKQTHFMVIEPAKGEYKNIFGGYDNVKVYGTNPKLSKLLRINPFSFPDEIHVLEHIDRLIEIFNVCWPMYAAMPAVLKRSVERAYEIVGWDLSLSECRYEQNGKKIYPNFVDVLNQINSVIKESSYSSDSKGDYIGALSTRISSLTNGINGQILTDNELSSYDLFDQNVIVDLSRVGSTETKSLLMGLLIIKLQEYRMARAKSNNKELRHITILEEAHNILKRTSTEQSQDSANLTGKSVEILSNAIAEMRTYGEGFIIVDQSPGLMDMSVIRNTNTKIILRLPDVNDRELVGKAAGLNDNQIVELAKLTTGVCAIYQNNWIEPVLCHVDEWNDLKNKTNLGEFEPLDNNNTAKIDVIKLALQPAHRLKKEDIEKVLTKISKMRFSSELKVNLIKLLEETNIETYRNLRKKIVYEVFEPDTILEKNMCYKNEISEWYQVMQQELIPQLELFSKEEIDKILALLVYEKNHIENKREYEELIHNLLLYIEKEGRHL